jgi:flagellar basal-body rod modification protein FlgD
MSVDATSILGVTAQQDMFLKLFMAQLQNQDPEEPMTNAEMVTQLAQLTTLDVMNSMNTSFKEVLKLQMLASGTDLIGRDVEFTHGGLVYQGTVDSVLPEDDGVKLMVGGNEVALSSVTKIL